MIPDLLKINRTKHETSEDSTSGQKTISNMGLEIIRILKVIKMPLWVQ